MGSGTLSPMQQLVWSFIPAPGDWGQRFRLYGVMIAIGVLVGLELARRRWQDRGGNPEDMSYIGLWAIPAGLIGARLYHVITDNELYRGHWFDNPLANPNLPPYPNSPLAIWHGGLGIPGGIAVGVIVGLIAGRARGVRLLPALDAAIPAIPLAQAIGRWGNYFNQELFGRPTTLPWGLEVSPDKRPAGYVQYDTFHPTFLYEMLWNLALVAFLIWLDKKRVLRPGRIVFVYLFGYFLGRLWVEALRSDEANTIFGLRINIWTSLIVMGASALTVAIIGLRRRPGDSDAPYADGHTWDPEKGIIPAPTDGEGDAGEDAPTDAPVGDAAGSADAEGSAVADAVSDEDEPVGAGAQRANGGDEATPDEDP